VQRRPMWPARALGHQTDRRPGHAGLGGGGWFIVLHGHVVTSSTEKSHVVEPSAGCGRSLARHRSRPVVIRLGLFDAEE